MSVLSDLLKGGAVAGTGLATGALGAPASLVSLMASGGKWLGKKIAPENVGAQKALDYLQKGAEYATPEALQGYAEQATGGYVKPETETQKAISEISQDIGSVVGVGGGAKAALKLATLGNTAKQAVKFAGGSDETANTAKLVGMMTSPLFKFNKLESMYGQLYGDARASLKKAGAKAVVPSRAIREAAKSAFKDSLEGSGSETAQVAARKVAKGSLRNLTKASVGVDQVWRMSRGINQEINKMGKYIGPKSAELYNLRNTVNNALKSYGKRNKDFGDAFKNAQTLFGIEKGLPLLDKAINKTVGLRDTGLSEYFRKSMVWGFGGLKGLFAKKYLGSLSKRGEAFVRSPVYRKASMQLAKATAKNSLPMTINAVRKLKSVHDDIDAGFTNKSGDRFEFVTGNKATVAQKPTKKAEFEVVSPDELAKLMKK